jgi:glycosyltransferase involved in cell wall biosynthesis
MKVIYKNCLINIAHNEKDAKIYQSWGVKSAILSTEVYPYDTYERVLLKTKNNVVVIGKFSDDEPYDQIILAAKNMDHVQFYFTGPIEKAKRKMDVNNLPKNVVLTGFLPQEEFIRLVKSVDVALALVTTAETMQMAAWEAMSCEVPIILSDWQLLRRTFPKGAIFVKNTQQSIVEGIQKFFANQELFQREISQLKAEKKILWDREVQKILAVITDIEQEQNKPQSLAPPRDVAPRP